MCVTNASVGFFLMYLQSTIWPATCHLYYPWGWTLNLIMSPKNASRLKKLVTLTSLGKGMAVDKNGLIYFVDGTMIRKVDQNGIISTLLGSNDLTSARPLTCDTSMHISQVAKILNWRRPETWRYSRLCVSQCFPVNPHHSHRPFQISRRFHADSTCDHPARRPPMWGPLVKPRTCYFNSRLSQGPQSTCIHHLRGRALSSGNCLIRT